jgi:2-oxoglutarate ferredoxin oxidoreductase subunit gamma
MNRRFEVRLAGTGGQGAILAGIILAEAAILDGKNVVQTQSYGPEARGGASRSEIVISDHEIDYPKVLEPDITLCMSQEGCDRYGNQTREGGLLILDADHVDRASTTQAVRVPVDHRKRRRPRFAGRVDGHRVAASTGESGESSRTAGDSTAQPASSSGGIRRSTKDQEIALLGTNVLLKVTFPL